MKRAMTGAWSAFALALVAATSGAYAADVPVWEDYVLSCSACHGLDGAGTPGVTPTLHDLAPLLDTPGGRAYLGRVPGVAQAPLSDERLARVLNWVLERYSGREPEPPYTAREIGALRAEPLRDTVAARAALTP
jgi:mono/diheme cytochrome c family protein